jgi:DNA-binding CsgD family transcriptional regulator
LQQGFLLVDADARPLFANRIAQALLDSGDAMWLDSGALSTSDSDSGRALRRLISSCAAANDLTTGGEVALPRTTSRLPLSALVTPISQDTAAIALPWTISRRPVAIVLVSDPETEVRAHLDSLRQRFGLTPAEATFALEIVKGDGRQAAADRLGITVGTARTHLTKIFDKTGTKRQAELVSLLQRK